MKREELSDIIGGIDEKLVLEASRYDSTFSSRTPKGMVHMKKKRIITFALAAALILALGIGAYAAGVFGGNVEITTTPIDHDDPIWEDVLKDSPYANEMQYARWEPHNNLATAEIEALLAEMAGKEEYSERSFNSVSEMEKTYGIELLKLGTDECHVQASLTFDNGKDASSGGGLLGSWNSYEDGVYLFTDFSYFFNNPELRSSLGNALIKIEEIREYEILSLGVAAQLVTGLNEYDGRSERVIDAYFSYGGIDYTFSVLLDPGYTGKEKLDITADWLCEKLESLQKPSWVSESAGPIPEKAPDDTPDNTVSSDESIWGGAHWEPHNNLPTDEIEAMLSEMEGKNAYSDRNFNSVREMEKAYGIELLKPGTGECNVQSSLCFWDENDPAAGAHLLGSWNAWADGVYFSNGFSYFFNNPNAYSSMGFEMSKTGEIVEYKIRSLGVTAQLVSGQSGQYRALYAFFSYGGVDYNFEAILDPTISTIENLDDITLGWLCEKLETLQKPSWTSETAGPVWETTSNVTVFSNDNGPVFDAEKAGPSGVILTKSTIDPDDPAWKTFLEQVPALARAKEALSVEWAPHGNLPTAEIESILKELDEETPTSSQSFDSVEDMEKYYGIELLRSNEEEDYVSGHVSRYAFSDFTGTWSCCTENVWIHTMARYLMDSELHSSLGTFWTSIEEEGEYEIRSLGVTARLVSGLSVAGEDPAQSCVMAFFTCDGVDYEISARADEGQELSIAWLCKLLETLHK